MYLDSLLEDIFSTHNNFYDVTKENFPQDYKMDDFYEELRFINERNASEQRLHPGDRGRECLQKPSMNSV